MAFWKKNVEETTGEKHPLPWVGWWYRNPAQCYVVLINPICVIDLRLLEQGFSRFRLCQFVECVGLFVRNSFFSFLATQRHFFSGPCKFGSQIVSRADQFEKQTGEFDRLCVICDILCPHKLMFRGCFCSLLLIISHLSFHWSSENRGPSCIPPHHSVATSGAPFFS